MSSQRSSGEEGPGGPLGVGAAGVAAQQVPGGRLQGLRHQGGAPGQVEHHQAALHHVRVAVRLGGQRGADQHRHTRGEARGTLGHVELQLQKKPFANSPFTVNVLHVLTTPFYLYFFLSLKLCSTWDF